MFVYEVFNLKLHAASLYTAPDLVTFVVFPVQLEAAKKSYHMACKEEKLAVTREANSKGEASVTADQQKKLHEKVEKCKQDSQKVRISAPGFAADLWLHLYASVCLWLTFLQASQR